MQRNIHIERVFPYPVERVWQALADPAALGAWFMPNDLDPVVGRAFTFRMKPQRGWDGVTHCEVLEVVPLQRLAFTYRGEATGEKVIACAGVTADRAQSAGKGVFTRLDTVLRFTLRSEGDKTRLVLDHEGFTGFVQVLVSFVMGMGYERRVLGRLEAVLRAQSTSPVESVCGNSAGSSAASTGSGS